MPRIMESATLAVALALLPAVLATRVRHAPARPFVVTAYEYTFQAPDSIPGGLVAVRLVNRGKIGHQVALLRLDDSSSLVTPGRYVIVGEYDGDNGHTHETMGMIRPLTVTGPAPIGPGKLPATPVTIRLTEYHLAISAPLHAGRQRVRVENDGAQHHHLSIVRIPGKATLAELDQWDGHSTPAPIEPVNGGTTILDAGQASVISLDLRRGRYLFACILSDNAEAKPHYLLGMEQVVAIK